MRISDNMIYGATIETMNQSLNEVIRLGLIQSSQKKLLYPSDNPAGMGTALELHAQNGSIEHFMENVKTAQGWLELGDKILGEASKTVAKIQTLAQQASTETYTNEQRASIAKQLRELLGTLVNQANTRFAGKSIFAGHKVDATAFDQILGATVLDKSLDDGAVESVTGKAPHTITVDFTNNGVVGGGTDLGYRYSTDGGKSWKNGTLAAGRQKLNVEGCTVTLKNGINVKDLNTDGGTRINVRPAVVYNGDDSDGVTVKSLNGSSLLTTTLGHFDQNVVVRVDNTGTVPGPVNYSYSLDGGSTWTSGNVSSNARLTIPGGALVLASNAGANTFSTGSQFVVAPNTADIRLSISRTQSVTVNNVGKDVFGGLYRKPGETALSKTMPDKPDRNLFETVAELIGFVESNDVKSIGKSLEKIKTSHAHLEGVNGTLGARVNLTDFVLNSLDTRKSNNRTYLANIESADLATVMSDLEKQKFIYSSVLKTNKDILELNSLSIL